MNDATLILGDALDVLPTLPAASFDCVITDPPYSSGGLYRGDRARPADRKYTQTEYEGRRPDFGGDNMDQRSWGWWCQGWLSGCRRVAKPGAYILVFTDWRQLPATTDAFQAAGWLWRGLIAWDKTEGTRAPHRGRFKHQCEFVVWGSNGPLLTGAAAHFGHLPGCYRVPVRQSDKHHLTGKPTDLMRALVKCCPPGGTILDPFAGSGTTLKAALLEGRKAVGVERDPAYFAIAEKRIAAARREGVA